MTFDTQETLADLLPEDESHPLAEGDRLALFDLDGTLIPWDTQLLFCNYVQHRSRRRTAFLLLFVPGILLYGLRLVNETFMKRLFLSYLWGARRDDINLWAQEFVRDELPHHYYPEMLKTLRDELDSGAYCVLATASPDFYARPIAKFLGVQSLLSTRVSCEKTLPFLPKLPDGNNKSDTKVTRLQAKDLLPSGNALPRPHTSAYSDSKADLPMLQAATRIGLVHPSPYLLSETETIPREVYTPPRPWKNKLHKYALLMLQLTGLFPLHKP